MRVHPHLGKQSTNSAIDQVSDYLRQQFHYFNLYQHFSARLGLKIAGLTLFLSTITSINISYHLSHRIKVDGEQSLVEIADTQKQGYQVETWSNGDQYLTSLASTHGFRDYPTSYAVAFKDSS